MVCDSNNPAFKATLMIAGDHNPHDIAQEAWESANKLLTRFENNQCLYPELDLRASLKKMLLAFWYYRDNRIEISERMHRVGVYLAKNFNCEFKFNGENYYTDCPNMLLHKDFGFSLRALEEYVCSICGKDPIDCEHRTGKVYNGIEAKKVISIIELIAFDLVREPEMIFTRINEIPYSKEYIVNGLKNDPNFGEFEYGITPIDCHHCLSCKGYDPSASDSLFERNSI